MTATPQTAPDTALKDLDTRLARYVQAPTSDPYLSECTATATQMVTAHCGQAIGSVPAPVLDRAVLEVAANLYHRRAAINGVTGLEDTDTTTADPVPRNPMAPAYPILRPYMWPAIA